MRFARRPLRLLTFFPVLAAIFLGGTAGALLGVCGPFTDVAGDTFCPLVLEIFYLGITTGTTATTYDPASSVSRLQMAAFLSRTVDGVLRRGSRRAVHNQNWTPQDFSVLGQTTVGSGPLLLQSDGADLWVANGVSGTVTRVRASDGRVLDTYSGAFSAYGVVVAMGRVLVTGNVAPNLYMIDPSQLGSAVTIVASTLGTAPTGIGFDGRRFWTGNEGSVSIITPTASIPWTVTTVTTGFGTINGVVFDGANIWVTEASGSRLLKLDNTGAILQTVTVGLAPQFPVFDGSNFWVPNYSFPTLSVVRASTGAVLQTITGNGLSGPVSAAFDGERILVTNSSNPLASLWKAADFTSLGNVPLGGTQPWGACSDRLNFWITLYGTGRLVRF